MEIVKLSEDWFLEVTCEGKVNNDGGCNTVVRVYVPDLVPRIVHRQAHFLWVCPKCGRLNCIEEQFIPKNIQYDCIYLYKQNYNAWQEMLTHAHLMYLENFRRQKQLCCETDKDAFQELKHPEKILQKKQW